MKIIIIDYQVGNIGSIINMLKKIGVEATCSQSIDDIRQADKLILPGVGAFDHGMKSLFTSKLVPVLEDEVFNKKKPLLGICLGMQLLLNSSEEGQCRGLGWIKGRCIRFSFNSNKNTLKIPHMGWNQVQSRFPNPFFNGEGDERFYFVHSYHAVCENKENILGTSLYGYEFPAVLMKENIIGAQFHPEKSHRYGMQFLKGFIEFSP